MYFCACLRCPGLFLGVVCADLTRWMNKMDKYDKIIIGWVIAFVCMLAFYVLMGVI